MKEPHDDQVLLNVHQLSKQFPIPSSKDIVHAVNEVSFKLRKGEVLGIVGESGSGKTTVGRCILGLEQVTSGEIHFKGYPLHRLPEDEWSKVRPKLQMVFQDPYDSLHPRMTIQKVLEQPLYLMQDMSKNDLQERVFELLDMVRLPRETISKYAYELTGGQLQRIGIARAISTNPDLIVLDEPTSVLDIAIRGEILRLLKDLQQKQGFSYIFISHDLSAVRNISDRVAIMYLGKIVELASSASLFKQQHHPYSRALLSAALFPDPSRRQLPFKLKGEIPSPIHLPVGCYLKARCPNAMDVCSQKPPELKEVKENHFSSCLLSEEW